MKLIIIIVIIIIINHPPVIHCRRQDSSLGRVVKESTPGSLIIVLESLCCQRFYPVGFCPPRAGFSQFPGVSLAPWALLSRSFSFIWPGPVSH